MLSKRVIQNLRKKAVTEEWSEEKFEIEKQKLVEQFFPKDIEEELEEKAKELGYQSYAEQQKQALIKKIEGNYNIEKVIAPPPMKKEIKAIEFTDPNIPGEIKIDTSGKLLKTFFQYEGQIGSLIDQYNNFITLGLQAQIISKTLTIPNGIISFENIILNRPLQKDITGTTKPFYPQEARYSGASYTADIYVDMVLNKNQPNEETLKKVFLGKIPVMLGSELDWLTTKTSQEKVNLGESLADPYGYFVIKGNEKIVLIQEKLRANRFFVFNSNNKGEVVCKITNNTLAGSSQITMVKDISTGVLKIHLAFMGRMNSSASDKLGETMNVLQIYRMLGVTDSKDILNYIFLFTKPENIKKMYVALQPSIVDLSKIGDDIEYISEKKGMGNLPYDIRKSDIMTELLNQLFPQIEPDNKTGKIYMLSIMTVRLLEYHVGVRPLDDRDNWGNKQLVTAGKSLELLFASIWRETINQVQNEIDSKKLNGLSAVKSTLRPAFVTDNFIESFTANNWGVQSANSYIKKENITDILKRDSILSVYSHLTKINTPGSTKVKSSKIRMVQMSQLGYVDPGETPEGQLCIAKGTPILMSDFSWKNIEELNDGDKVITVNPFTTEKSVSEIYNVFTFHTSTKEKKMYELTLKNGKSIKGTGDHPFLTQYGWLPLDKLNSNLDMVLFMNSNSSFNYESIESVKEIPDMQVYDFTTVSQNHSFIADCFVTHNCGLAKNASMTAYMSLDRPEEIIIEIVREYISSLPDDEHVNSFMLNGVFMGWVNGVELKEICVNLKRSLKLPKDTAIVLERDGFFNIYTDAARPTRPLLIVDTDGKLLIEKKNLWNADFETLLREGCVEYIDAWEQENIMLAQTLEDVKFRQRDIEMALQYVKEAQEKLTTETYIDPEDEKNDKIMLSQAEAALKELTDLPVYTHSEIDPTAILSIAIGIIPLPETNPGPRLTYQAGMGKQSLGIYHSNHSVRFDTTSKVLAYPSRPMFETQFTEMIGLNELPAGETVILAISTYSGYSQEDAIVMAKGAIDRGLFRSVIYRTEKSILKSNEKFARPEVRKGKEDKYAAIDENGFPRLGAFVKEGDCLIGKIRITAAGRKEDASTYVGVKQEGVVDRVLVSTNAENNRVVKVKIRQIRKPVMGDKFASRYAQKGTIGLILPDEDMPFTASGVRPDIIINPHCMPSRMTMGKMIEIVTSKVAAFTGERVNATAFRRFDVQEFMRNLKAYGYSGSGKERMYSGYTGKPLEAMIFTGPCYYQALRHQVQDKIQMRARGGISQLTHQPVEGRKRGGGLRVGEMERDALISHGASAFLRERLCLVSDAYETVFCSTCGTMAISNVVEEKYICKNCDDKAVFGVCTIPYSFKLLTQLLSGANFQTRFKLKEVKK